ncbi:hypothetical protein EYS14_20030 [Alteromonadaceae bacterium M269]|nr:hypothetical protein EYS14_20030 [Alteromonadaceae bacterium M269]
MDYFLRPKLVVLIFFLSLSMPSFATIITGNLLLNAGAEDGLDNWTNIEAFEFASRSESTNIGGFLDQTEGERWFATFGGPAGSNSTIVQDVDVSGFSFDGITSSVIFGGDAFASSARRPPAGSTLVRFSVLFFDELDNLISSDVLTLLAGFASPESVSDARQETLVPENTQTIQFQANGFDGTFAATVVGVDDLHLSLSNITAVPEPKPTLLFMTGLLAMLPVLKRRRANKIRKPVFSRTK